MKKKNVLPVFVAAALVFVSLISCYDINNPVIDEWWHGETPNTVLTPITVYTVHFEMRGGAYVDLLEGPGHPLASPPDQKVLKDGKADEPGLVVKNENFFSGWYTTAAATGTPYDFSTPVTQDMTLYAGWSGSGKVVEFNLNPKSSGITAADTTYYNATKNPDGVPLDEKIADGALLSQPKGFALKGAKADDYFFIDWYTDEACTKKWDFTKPVTDNMTLYALWAEKTSEKTATPPGEPTKPVYTILFNSGGADDTPPKQQKFEGDTVDKPSLLTKLHYVFAGWYESPSFSGSPYVFSTTVTKDMTLYAKWIPEPNPTYTVDFDMNGGTYVDLSNSVPPIGPIPPQKIPTGRKAHEPGLVTNSTKPYFSGWYKTKAGADSLTPADKWDFGDTVTDDMTLHAGWSGSGATVKFDLNPPIGSGIMAADTTYYNATKNPDGVPLDEKIATGTVLSQPKDFGLTGAKAGEYLFIDWYTEPECDTKWDFTKPVTNNMTLYAGWAEKTSGKPVSPPEAPPEQPPKQVYTISFDSDDAASTPPEQQKFEGDTVDEPSLLTKLHYVFDYWYTVPGTPYDFSTPVTENTTLYAEWIPETDPIWTVTFNMNGGSYVDLRPSTDPNYVPPAGPIPEQKISKGKEAHDPGLVTNPAKPYFSGWYKTKAGADNLTPADKWDFGDTVPDDLDLYAGWSGTGSTVNFNLNPPTGSGIRATDTTYYSTKNPYGVPVSEKIVTGTVLSQPKDFGLTGAKANDYVFGGWYTDADCTTKWNFEDEVTETMTLYAGWAKIMTIYTITFYSNGADAPLPPNQEKLKGNTVDQPSLLTKPHNIFDGWYKSSSFIGSPYDFSTPVTGNMPLYAKWIPEPNPIYTVKFNMNGGRYVDLLEGPGHPLTNPPEQKIPEDGEAHEPGLVEKTGGYFSGWYTTPEGANSLNPTDKWDFTTPVTDDLDLYAGWSGNGKTITFDLNPPTDSGITATDTTYYSTKNRDGVPLPENVVTGTILSQPKDFGLKDESARAKEYVFAGWYTDKACTSTTKWDFTKPVTGDVEELYAGWARIITRKIYTVTFNSNGADSTPLPQQKYEGDPAEKPSLLTKPDYVFDGWYTTPSFAGTPYDFSTPITKDMPLYAKWEPEPYTPPWFESNFVVINPPLSESNEKYYPFQLDPGYDDVVDIDHVGGGANYNANFNNMMEVIDQLKKRPNAIALIEGYADADTPSGEASAKLIADREVSAWWQLRTETGVGEDQLVMHTKLPEGYDKSKLSSAMLIGPNDPHGAVEADGYEIKVTIYLP